MAKVKAPLFSYAAHGSIGSAITFSQRLTHNHVRRQNSQLDSMTEAQLNQRDKFIVSGILWTSIPQAERDYWTEIAAQGFAEVP